MKCIIITLVNFVINNRNVNVNQKDINRAITKASP
jgi:hypothetical protein